MKTFDKKELVPVADFKFGSPRQKNWAEAVGAKFVYKTRDTDKLPQYVIKGLVEMNLSATRIGRTSFISSTWAIY